MGKLAVDYQALAGLTVQSGCVTESHWIDVSH